MTEAPTLTLSDLVHRNPPLPWAEGDNIPWDEPNFSRRMLREHLSQAHDRASRRSPKITEQLKWIHGAVLASESARVLDLTCGPGLYTSGLARMGHHCHGLDFGPASIEYARELAAREGLDCTYDLGDVRTTPFGAGYRLVMMLFGQFNVFRRTEAQDILRRAYSAMTPGGTLLLEPQRYEAIAKAEHTPATWYAVERGLFSDQSHLCLTEHAWDAAAGTSTIRFYIVDATTGTVMRHALSNEAYTDED